MNKPQDIGIARYKAICHMRAAERALFMFLVNRSKAGMWTTYEECAQDGMKSPTKVMSDVRKRPNVRIHSRIREGKTMEFCV